VTNFGHHAMGVAMRALELDQVWPEEFWNLGAEWPEKGDLFDTATKAHFGCRFPNGLEVEFVTEPNNSYVVRIEGDKGWIETTGRKVTASSPEIAKSVPGSGTRDQYINHYRNFIDCVKTRKTPNESVEIGHCITSVCHLGNIAMKLDRKIRWDAAKQTIVGDDQAAKMLERPHRGPWSYNV